MNETPTSWYYLDALNQPVGPLDDESMHRLREDYDFYVWRDGMPEWTLASQYFSNGVTLPELASPQNTSIKKPKAKRLGKTAKELVSVCQSIIADGVVTPGEAEMLRNWIIDHPDVSQEWPANVLCERITQVFADGVVDANEQMELLEILRSVCGDPVSEKVATPKVDASLFEPQLPSIDFEDCSFAFIGKFVHGSTARCKEEVRIRGGVSVGSIYNSTRYVVVGALGLTDQKMAELRAWRGRSNGATIIPEAHWQSALRGYSESLVSIYGDEDGASGINPLDPKEYLIPRASGFFGNVIGVESSSGNGTYAVNLKDQTCTCPDFTERRGQFPVGDVRRACKHICRGIVEKRLEMPIFLEDAMRNRIEIDRGFPVGDWYAWCDLEGRRVFVGANHSGWVNLFTPSRLRSGLGPYSDFGYSLYEQRWAYGNRPHRSLRLGRFIHEQDQLLGKGRR